MKSIIICIIYFALILLRGSSAEAQELNIGDSYGSLSNNGILGNLSGPGKYVAVPHSPLLTPGPTGTVEAWVYLTAHNTSNAYILQKGQALGFGINGSTGNTFLSINNVQFVAADPVPLNRWVHVAASWSNSGANYTVNFFRDGILSSNQTQAAAMPTGTDSVTIGGSKLTPAAFVNGYIDELRLWNFISDDASVSNRRFTGLGDAPIANQDSSLTYNALYRGLVASWTFNITGNEIYEDINNLNGYSRGGAQPVFTNVPSQPVPYNLAMYFPGTIYDYIKVPHNAAYNLTGGGTIELWVYNYTTSTGKTLISKGATLNTTTFRIYIEASGSLRFQIGNSSVPGGVVPADRWNHVAVAWTLNAGIYTAKFYINGQYMGQNTIASAMPLNSDDIHIGNLQWDNGNSFLGFMDEIRIWQRELTPEEVRLNMFNSARSLTTVGPLVAAWDFEGNLNNVTGATGRNGTFKTGNTVNRPRCQFSGYSNEFIGGPLTDMFNAHSTTINRNENPNPFPAGFSLKVPNKSVLTGINTYDTIFIPGNTALTSVEVFLSLQHHSIGGISVFLKAPNGVERTLSDGTGGNAHSILTFFRDGSPSQSSFFSPWSYLAGPTTAMGNFGGSSSQGSWVLRVQHNGGSPEAYLLGWGLRINNSVTGIEPLSNIIPGKFSLEQNYPNPFNPSTEIQFGVPKDVKVKISVFDILGREVQVLADEFKTAGEYKVTFDASKLPSGVYFYTINAGTFSDTKKMILIK